jgi:hypothetical protein
VISLKVSQHEALSRIHQIPHAKAFNASKTFWRILPDGRPDPRSVCWLYCWAKTGMNSDSAAHEAQRVFDDIFNVSFSWMDKRIDHEWAREARYASRDVSKEMTEQLSR